MYSLSFSDMIELVAIKCRVIEGLLEEEEITPEIMEQLSDLSGDINSLIQGMNAIRERTS